jgi:hypothetical protein
MTLLKYFNKIFNKYSSGGENSSGSCDNHSSESSSCSLSSSSSNSNKNQLIVRKENKTSNSRAHGRSQSLSKRTAIKTATVSRRIVQSCHHHRHHDRDPLTKFKNVTTHRKAAAKIELNNENNTATLLVHDQYSSLIDIDISLCNSCDLNYGLICKRFCKCCGKDLFTLAKMDKYAIEMRRKKNNDRLVEQQQKTQLIRDTIFEADKNTIKRKHSKQNNNLLISSQKSLFYSADFFKSLNSETTTKASSLLTTRSSDLQHRFSYVKKTCKEVRKRVKKKSDLNFYAENALPSGGNCSSSAAIAAVVVSAMTMKKCKASSNIKKSSIKYSSKF